VALAMSWSIGLGFSIALARIPGEVFHSVKGQMSGNHGDSSTFLQSLQGVSIDRFLLKDAVQNCIPIANFTSNHGHLGRIGYFASAQISALLFSSQHALGSQIIYGIGFLGLFLGEGWQGLISQGQRARRGCDVGGVACSIEQCSGQHIWGHEVEVSAWKVGQT
jgi:hypothetical protein